MSNFGSRIELKTNDRFKNGSPSIRLLLNVTSILSFSADCWSVFERSGCRFA